ncbi:PREDICTED: sodium/myo-inositol cotransporter-like [Priapulus caudatus]|uniref:Sodium/myo-inositol cotransporter-like n=1 Tax=Priapulus caudatus TaxID=37621 RepID=A0ABM1ETK4_PRICU|nr:PREDICTED: sodium/myo-inositol cotransporter-like [Priapulus caudatus]
MSSSVSISMEARGELDKYDITVIVIYFGLVLGAGLLSMLRSNRGTVSGYFLAGRMMIWLPVGASIFASNIGSEHFVGLAGSGAASGLGVGAFELNALVVVQLLGWIFLPVYIACGASTLPEYMHMRFGGKRLRVYLSCLSMLLYIFTKISVNLFSGSIFIQQSLGWNLYWSIFLLLGLTALCTVTGGLAAVIYTDTVQTVVMLVGGIALMITSFVKIGGWSSLIVQYMEAIPNTTKLEHGSTHHTDCGMPREDSWLMLRNPIDSDIPWAGFIFGQTIASIWYWCTDQMMVQRALAAKSLSHAQGGTLFAGYLKILPIFIMVLPGMISRVLFTDLVACVDPDVCERACGSRTSCSNLAYPLLVFKLMPSGARGVMVAVMLAALISDLTSIFNSSSTLFTIDIYTHIRKKASVKELMIVGRLFVLLMTAISVVWVPVIQTMQGGELYHYIQTVAAYLAPPIAAAYSLAIIWKRMNEKGCFYGLLVGFVVGITRMIIDFYYKVPTCMEKWTDGDPRPAFVKNVHYMYFALILFWLTITTAVIVSLLTSPLPAKHLVRTTYWTRNDHREIVDEDHFDEAAGIHDNEREQPGIPMEEKNKTETVDQESSSPVEHDYVAPTFRK